MALRIGVLVAAIIGIVLVVFAIWYTVYWWRRGAGCCHHASSKARPSASLNNFPEWGPAALGCAASSPALPRAGSGMLRLPSRQLSSTVLGSTALRPSASKGLQCQHQDDVAERDTSAPEELGTPSANSGQGQCWKAGSREGVHAVAVLHTTRQSLYDVCRPDVAVERRLRMVLFEITGAEAPMSVSSKGSSAPRSVTLSGAGGGAGPGKGMPSGKQAHQVTTACCGAVLSSAQQEGVAQPCLFANEFSPATPLQPGPGSQAATASAVACPPSAQRSGGGPSVGAVASPSSACSTNNLLSGCSTPVSSGGFGLVTPLLLAPSKVQSSPQTTAARPSAAAHSPRTPMDGLLPEALPSPRSLSTSFLLRQNFSMKTNPLYGLQ